MMRHLRRPVVWQTLVLLFILVTLFIALPLFSFDEDETVSVVAAVALFGAVLITLLWLRRFLRERQARTKLKAQAYEQAEKAGRDSLHDLAKLQKDFDAAFAELARACPGQGIFRSDGATALPWIMVLGPPGAGKSTSLSRSDLHFTPLGRKLQGIAGTRNCDWWLAEEAIFLDTAGRYAVQEEDHDEWLAFLALVRKQRRRPIDAALIQLGIDELLKMPEAVRRETAQHLRQRLDELMRHLRVRFPVYLVFSKCDRLPGFVEFFGGLSQRDREQPLGFSLDLRDEEDRLLKPLFEERFDGLVRNLIGRSTVRMTQIVLEDDPAQREARGRALDFPSELAQCRNVLRDFVETLFFPSRHSERPWLLEVHLTSAAQGSEALPGMRQGFIKQELGLVPPPGLQDPHTDPFFLKSLFSRIVAHARTAAQPSREHHRLSRIYQVAVGLCALIACFLATRILAELYQRDRTWLQEALTIAGEFRLSGEPGHLPESATKSVIDSELDMEIRLLDLLERPHGSLVKRTQRSAADLLRSRLDRAWLRPMQRTLDRRLDEAGRWQSGAPPQIYAEGFTTLKTAHILERRLCPGTKEEATRTWITDQFLDLWQHVTQPRVRKLLSTDTPEAVQLRRLLEFFFLDPAMDFAPYDLVDPKHRRPALTGLDFDASRRERAQKNLVSPKGANVVFLLIASNANLLSARQQLSGGLLTDPGIEAVFTPDGCERFFGSSASQGKEWWSCVLDFPLPPSQDLSDIYGERYREAWNRWLGGVSVKSDLSTYKGGKLVTQVQKAIGDLSRPGDADLDRLLRVIGEGTKEDPDGTRRRRGAIPRASQGPLRRLFSCAGKVTQTVDTLEREGKKALVPVQCVDAKERYAIFGKLTTPDRKEGPAKDETAEDQQERQRTEALRATYQRYLDALRKLDARLAKGETSADNRDQESLSLVLDTYVSRGELFDVIRTRGDFLKELDVAARKQDIDIGNLGGLLMQVERALWQGVVSLAAKPLQNLWSQNVLSDWDNIRARSGQDTAEDKLRCGKVVELWKDKVERFITTNLYPLSKNFAKCEFRELDGTLSGSKVNLSPSACPKLLKAREIISNTNCDGGSGGGGGNPVPRRADHPQDPPSCNYPVERVRVDTGTAVYECSISTSLCEPKSDKEVKSKGPSISVKQKSNSPDSARGFEEVFRGKTFSELLRRSKGPTRQGYRFDLPIRRGERCPPVSVTLTFDDVSGTSGPPSRTAWKGLDLPRSLLP